MDCDVSRTDEIGEVGGRKTITIRQRAAAHTVEQDVCEMMHAGGGITGLLQTICGGDACLERVARCDHISTQVGGELNRCCETSAEFDQCGVIQSGVCNAEPFMRCAGLKFDGRADEVRAECSAHFLFWRDESAAAECFDLAFGEQHDRIAMTERPRSRNAK